MPNGRGNHLSPLGVRQSRPGGKHELGDSGGLVRSLSARQGRIMFPANDAPDRPQNLPGRAPKPHWNTERAPLELGAW